MTISAKITHTETGSRGGIVEFEFAVPEKLVNLVNLFADYVKQPMLDERKEVENG